MRIDKITTIELPKHPHLLWVQIHTDEGIVGIGETTPRVRAVKRVIHDTLSGILLGRDPRHIERLWHEMFRALHYHGYAGSEFRGLSAVDLALWDIAGQLAGMPLYRLLGGECRDRVPIYNTCVSYGEIRDWEGFLHSPGDLAESLAGEGIEAMKIWPFDEASSKTLGNSISDADLKTGVRVVEEIRERVGNRIAIAIEGHSCWNLPAATRIARALEPYDVLFLEDMVLPDGVDALKSLRQSTTIPICGSERLFGRLQFYPVVSTGAVDIVMPDLVWTGGITEFRKVAALADTFQLPIAPHNCGGPVATAANVHVAAHVPNLLRLELVRAFYHGFYDELVTGVPVLHDGSLALPEGPGIGVRLRPEVLARPTTIVEESISTTSRGHWNEGDPWKNDLSDNF